MESVKSVMDVLKAKTLQNHISWLSIKLAHAGDQKPLVSVNLTDMALDTARDGTATASPEGAR